MKLIRTALLSVIVTLFMMPALTSCSDDDNSQDVEALLIGQWMLGPDFVEEDNEDLVMTFNADHTGKYELSEELATSFTWNYDATTGKLTLTTPEPETVTYIVAKVDCCELSLQDNVEDVLITFERLK